MFGLTCRLPLSERTAIVFILCYCVFILSLWPLASASQVCPRKGYRAMKFFDLFPPTSKSLSFETTLAYHLTAGACTALFVLPFSQPTAIAEAPIVMLSWSRGRAFAPFTSESKTIFFLFSSSAFWRAGPNMNVFVLPGLLSSVWTLPLLSSLAGARSVRILISYHRSFACEGVCSSSSRR